MDVGIFGTTWIFEVLQSHNKDALALDILRQTTYPSLGYMISQNATTLWEAWDGSAHEIGKEGTSRNHIMFGGGVNRFLAAAVGGLSVDARPLFGASSAGWRQMLVRPSPAAVRLLGRARVSRQTPRGTASVAWSTLSTASRLELDLQVPVGAKASVHLPLLESAGAPTRVSVKGTGCEVRCEASTGLANVPTPLKMAELSAACISFGLTSGSCLSRPDGERVLDIELGSGSFSFHVGEEEQVLL